MREVSTVFWPRRRKVIVGIASGLLVAFAVGVIVLIWHWPFSKRSVLKDLQTASLSSVTAQSYRGTYFPRPGCVLENVSFEHGPPGTPPLITIKRLRIEGTFIGLFTEHVRHIQAEGLQVRIPPRGSNESFGQLKRSKFVIDDLIADGAVLEILRRESGREPLRFSFKKFSLSNVGASGPASFNARFTNPEPPGEITAKGNFGPWSAENIGKTPVSGDYLFQHADLGIFGGIAGLLSSSGKFAGELEHIAVQGVTEVPDFKVTASSHQQPVKAEFHAVVNGTNGDTFVQRVEARFRDSTVSAEGRVAGGEGKPGKIASFDLAVNNGRIQDFLLLFVRSPRAPMSGSVSFRAHAAIPSEKQEFVKKVELQGDFGIEDSTFAKPETQREVDRLSAGAMSGEKSGQKEDHPDDPEMIVSDVKGHVVLKDGVATFSKLSFSVPGALGQVAGTYSLLTQKINFRGTLKTLSQPSKSTQGIKSVMMKFLDPFFKKKDSDYLVPVKITGTYGHPAFALDLNDSQAKKSGSESRPHKEK
jgi:hypothetical protein